jgi:cell wall-associated NlpC family hydrolase
MVCKAGLLLMAFSLSIPTAAFAAKTHKVKKNETIASLARKYHVPESDLKEVNNRLNSHIKPGDMLIIPPRGSKKSASNTSLAAYKVKKGDTLTRISRKTGVSIAELKRLNGLPKGRLKPGQMLALSDNDSGAATDQRVPAKQSLRYAELMNEQEYQQSLAELLEQDSVGFGLDDHMSAAAKPETVKTLQTKAFGFLGTRYRFGGSSRNGLDCSAFVQKVFNEMDVSLPRTAREQFKFGEIVHQGDMRKGDLVFFSTYASFPSHVGIYLGDNRMIHASSSERRVVISSLDTPYYRSRFIGAKRISNISADNFNLDDLMLGVEEESSAEATINDLLGADTAKLP